MGGQMRATEHGVPLPARARGDLADIQAVHLVACGDPQANGGGNLERRLERELGRALAMSASVPGPSAPLVVAERAMQGVLRAAYRRAGAEPGAVLWAPDGADRASALALAARWLRREGHGGLVLVAAWTCGGIEDDCADPDPLRTSFLCDSDALARFVESAFTQAEQRRPAPVSFLASVDTLLGALGGRAFHEAPVRPISGCSGPVQGGPPPVFRPWGRYRSVHRHDGVQVKEIVVEPGAQLSLQRHRYRSEHWVVVSGEALVTCGGETRLVGWNETFAIPCGEVHRLANPGEVPLRIIEVQLGTYLGEDDIVRIADDYGRA